MARDRILVGYLRVSRRPIPAKQVNLGIVGQVEKEAGNTRDVPPAFIDRQPHDVLVELAHLLKEAAGHGNRMMVKLKNRDRHFGISNESVNRGGSMGRNNTDWATR